MSVLRFANYYRELKKRIHKQGVLNAKTDAQQRKEVRVERKSSSSHREYKAGTLSSPKRAVLKCKPSKCEILRNSIKYLGRMVGRHGVKPDPEVVEAVLTGRLPVWIHSS